MTDDLAGASPVQRPVRPLRPYMCWCGDPAEGAVLAWAHTVQEARTLAHPAIADWTDAGFLDVRARLLREHAAYLESLRTKDVPHVNADPPVCPTCERWGAPQRRDGHGCLSCYGDD